MGGFVAGEVVVTAFPFSDLSSKKRRPALVLAVVEFGDLILCQITSSSYSSKTAVAIDASAFASGGLPIVSYVRPDKLFTADVSLIEKSAGALKSVVFEKIRFQVRELF